MAAAATDIGDLPATISISTAFRAMRVAPLCTIFGNPTESNTQLSYIFISNNYGKNWNISHQG